MMMRIVMVGERTEIERETERENSISLVLCLSKALCRWLLIYYMPIDRKLNQKQRRFNKYIIVIFCRKVL